MKLKYKYIFSAFIPRKENDIMQLYTICIYTCYILMNKRTRYNIISLTGNVSIKIALHSLNQLSTGYGECRLLFYNKKQTHLLIYVYS